MVYSYGIKYYKHYIIIMILQKSSAMVKSSIKSSVSQDFIQPASKRQSQSFTRDLSDDDDDDESSFGKGGNRFMKKKKKKEPEIQREPEVVEKKGIGLGTKKIFHTFLIFLRANVPEPIYGIL